VDALFKSKRVKVYILPSPLCPPLKAYGAFPVRFATQPG